MAESYSITKADGVTSIRFRKAPSVEDLRRIVQEVAQKHSAALRLWDFTDSGLDLAPAELKDLAEYAKAQDFQPSKVAIVVPDDLAFGLSRMYEVYREDKVAEHRVFRSEEQARTWLEE